MIRPSSYIPPEQYPVDKTTPDNVPAFVLEMPAVKVVRLWHKDGPFHENAQLTVERYVRRGWRVETVWDKDALIVPRSRPLPRAA